MAQYPNDLSSLYASVIAQQQRFVVKVGTDVLADKLTGKLSEPKIEEIVNQTAALYQNGRQVAIVTSGAVGTGKALTGIDDSARYLALLQSLAEAGITGKEAELAIRQASAAIGQPKLIEIYNKYLAKYGLGAQLLASYHDLSNSEHRKNFVSTVRVLYMLNAIPILNENDPFSTEELKTTNGNGDGSPVSISFGDNDLLSVMVAETLDSQVLFLLSELRDGSGLMDYDKRAKLDVIGDAQSAMQYVSDTKSQHGTGGMRSKLESIVRATDSGIFVVLLSGLEENGISRVMHGEPIGTLFLPKNFK